jgi:ATP synthase protein I
LAKDGAKEDAELAARLKRLSQDLGAARGSSSSSDADVRQSEEMLRARSAGFRLLGEFVAGVVAGLLIGYFIDRAAGTSPAFLIVFLFLGTGAGFWNIYRAAQPPGGPGGKSG